MAEAKELGAPYELVRLVAAEGKLPVPNFAAGGIATPADAALMMQLGAEAVFVGSGIFKSERSAATGPGDRAGDDALPGPGSRRRGVARSGRRDARHRDGRSWPRPNCCRRGGGDGAVSAYWRCRATSPGPRAGASRTGTESVVEVRHVRAARGPRRPDHPRRREHDAAQPDAGRAVVRGAARISRSRRRAVRHLRRSDPARPRGARSGPAQPGTARRDDPAQRLRPADRLVRDPHRSGAGSDRPLTRGLHPRAALRAGSAPSVEVLARLGDEPVLVRQGRVLAATFHPELTADRRLQRMFLEHGRSSHLESNRARDATNRAADAPVAVAVNQERRITC